MSDEPYLVPCERPENDPQDWFIEKDGKQYPFDDLITDDDVADYLERVDPPVDQVSIKDIREILEAEAVKDALVRRRHAKDKCHVECYFRLQCLEMALDQHERYGTWGGYYAEELRAIRRTRDARQRRRQGVD